MKLVLSLLVALLITLLMIAQADVITRVNNEESYDEDNSAVDLNRFASLRGGNPRSGNSKGGDLSKLHQDIHAHKHSVSSKGKSERQKIERLQSEENHMYEAVRRDISLLYSYRDHIDELKTKIQHNHTLGDLLVESLKKANDVASQSLNPELYGLLRWPVTLVDYYDYLEWYVMWTPLESNRTGFKNPDLDNTYQEVYDMLCHFYFLIDQDIQLNQTMQDDPWFQNWLISFASDWGSFLDSPLSFNDTIMDSFLKYAPNYAVADSLIPNFRTPNLLRPNSPSNWTSFNQFFARRLNTGLRPISSIHDNTVVTAPADTHYRQDYKINSNLSIPNITIKGTHRFATIDQLLNGSQHANAFANGTFVHYFLSPYSYHHFHSPVSGKVLESRAVQGQVYLAVEIKNQQFDAPDDALDGYEFTQARGIIILDTSQPSVYQAGNVGLVAIIPIGMCQVSSVSMVAKKGQELYKGEEFGFFTFGGSDIIVLFQEQAKPQLTYKDSDVYRLYGQQIAKLSLIS